MILLTNQEKKIHRRQIKKSHTRKKRFSTYNGNKKYHKVRDHCHYTEKYRGASPELLIAELQSKI